VEILYAYPKWQAGALLQAAKCHERLGQTDAAAALYARVVKTYSDTPAAEEAANRLRMAELRSSRRHREYELRQ
jgi:TolA-binding protein